LHKVSCTVCDFPIELSESTKEGDRFTCPNCFAQLAFRIEAGKMVALCAMCNKTLRECGDDCERKLNEREKRGFFDIKL